MSLRQAVSPLHQLHDAALVDLDGVIYRGPEVVAHAPEVVAQARSGGMPIMFVTNNASREPEDVAGQLTRLGVPAAPDEVMTSAQAAGALLAAELPRGSSVLVVGGAGLRTAVSGAGMRIVESAADDPAAVVQGFSPDVGWRQLAEAAYAIQRGAWHLATNLDRTLPNEHGLAPGNGALVGAVVEATGRTPVSAGKPEPGVFRLAADRIGAADPVVVGDRLDTDLAGARAAGYAGLHVFTGVHGVSDVLLAPPEHRPTYIGADLRSLLEPHPEPIRAGSGWWTVHPWAARITRGVLELQGPEALTRRLPIDLVRAACAASWTAADDGEGPDRAGLDDLTVCAPEP